MILDSTWRIWKKISNVSSQVIVRSKFGSALTFENVYLQAAAYNPQTGTRAQMSALSLFKMANLAARRLVRIWGRAYRNSLYSVHSSLLSKM